MNNFDLSANVAFEQLLSVANRMVAYTFLDGGYTYELTNQTGDYVVGNNSLFPNGENQFGRGEFNAKVLVPFLYAAQLLGYDGVGTWYDSGSDVYYVDLVKFVLDYDEAKRLALQNGELAVFNRKTFEVINL